MLNRWQKKIYMHLLLAMYKFGVACIDGIQARVCLVVLIVFG
jgi:hypothetical protein